MRECVCRPLCSAEPLVLVLVLTSSGFPLGLAFPLLPANLAWIFATSPVFLYPELLPVCSLDPAVHSQHHRSIYTAGEDGYVDTEGLSPSLPSATFLFNPKMHLCRLIVLGLKHFERAVQPDQLISSYLLCKDRWSVRKHVREMSSRKAPASSVIKVTSSQWW